MRVDKPKYDSCNPIGSVTCTECPFANEDGYIYPDTPMAGLCDEFGAGRDTCCPTAETYQEACDLVAGECECGECPLHGDASTNNPNICTDWMVNHNDDCPTKETYQEACDLADGQPMLPGL